MSGKNELIQAFDDLKEALTSCHVNSLDDIISDDYMGFSLNGTIENKKDILDNFRPGGINLSKYEVEDIRYEVFTEIGIISGKGMISGSYGEFNFEHDVLFTDIFKNTKGTWKYYRAQVTEIPPT
jgi:hypothetical protein